MTETVLATFNAVANTVTAALLAYTAKEVRLARQERLRVGRRDRWEDKHRESR